MIRLRTFGTVDLRSAEQPAESIALQPKQLALLVYLAANQQDEHRRDKLLGVFWPGLDRRRARSALNQALYGLRQRLGREAIRSHGNESVSRNRQHVWCDAAAFEEHLSAGRPAAGLELYRGPFLDGFHISNGGPFERWLDGRGATLHAKAVEAAKKLVREASRNGDPRQVERWLRRLRVLAPADEDIVRHLMRLLQGSGRRAAALRTYRELTDHLREELDFDPSRQTRELARKIEMGIARRRSVAVLPFTELGPDPVADGFGAGLAEEVLSAVARMASITVVGGISANRAKLQGGSLSRIAEALGVDTIVAGSVRRFSEHLRVTVRLVRGTDGAGLWADRYDLPYVPTQIFELQEELARNIAQALEGTVGFVEERPSRVQPTTDPRAYALYLEGRHAWRQRTADSLEEALSLFRESLQRDPANAQAWSGMADAHVLLPIFASAKREESYDAALEAAARALELDPTLAEARTSLARVYVHARRWEEAEEELRQALEIRPSYAPARHWLADLLMRTGRRDEALEHADQLVALEPLSTFTHTGRGFLLYLARQFDAAIEAIRRSRSLEDSAAATTLETLSLIDGGQPEDAALRMAEQGLERWPRNIWVRAASGYVHARLGADAKARTLVADLDLEDEPTGAFYAGMILVALDRVDEAFPRLEEGEWNSTEVDLFVSGPPFDSIRRDSRYERILTELDLPVR